MPGSEISPLARLVLFMVCLSLAGSLAAGVHYIAIDLPQQAMLQAPENSQTNSLVNKCIACMDNCNYLPDSEKNSCLENCELIC